MGLFDVFRPKGVDLPAPKELPRLPSPKPSGLKPAKPNPFAFLAPKTPKAPQLPAERPGGLFEHLAPGAPKPRSIEEALVPKEERGSQYRKEPDAFEVFREEPPSPPRREPEASRQVAAIPTGRDPFEAWLDHIFNFSTFWDHVRDQRKNPKFQDDLSWAQDPHIMDLPSFMAFPFARPGPEQDLQIAWTLGIPFDRLERAYEKEGSLYVWDEILAPELEKVQTAMNDLMPRDLRGMLQFGEAEDGSFGLLYIEDPLTRLR